MVPLSHATLASQEGRLTSFQRGFVVTAQLEARSYMVLPKLQRRVTIYPWPMQGPMARWVRRVCWGPFSCIFVHFMCGMLHFGEEYVLGLEKKKGYKGPFKWVNNCLLSALIDYIASPSVATCQWKGWMAAHIMVHNCDCLWGSSILSAVHPLFAPWDVLKMWSPDERAFSHSLANHKAFYMSTDHTNVHLADKWPV